MSGLLVFPGTSVRADVSSSGARGPGSNRKYQALISIRVHFYTTVASSFLGGSPRTYPCTYLPSRRPPPGPSTTQGKMQVHIPSLPPAAPRTLNIPRKNACAHIFPPAGRLPDTQQPKEKCRGTYLPSRRPPPGLSTTKGNNAGVRPPTPPTPRETAGFQLGPLCSVRGSFSSLRDQLSSQPYPFSSPPEPFSRLPGPSSSVPVSLCSLAGPISSLPEPCCCQGGLAAGALAPLNKL